VALAALVVASTGLCFYSQRTSRSVALGNRDPVVLADFTNATGDAVFDDALKQALAVALDQSPFLSIYSDERVQDVLRLMGRSPGERVTRAASGRH
jgi:hypothetical protein